MTGAVLVLAVVSNWLAGFYGGTIWERWKRKPTGQERIGAGIIAATEEVERHYLYAGTGITFTNNLTLKTPKGEYVVTVARAAASD